MTLAEPLSLVTIYHTGAYSAVEAWKRQGLQVVPGRGAGLPAKLEAIERNPGAPVVWCHWNWIRSAPAWVLDRRVVTMLRDPVEVAISAVVRGHEAKVVQQTRQWLELWRHRDRVDDWIDFRALDLSRFGIDKMPHENATGEHPLKRLYTERRFRELRKMIPRQWAGLKIVAPEIVELFELAGLAHRLDGCPIVA